VNQEKGVRKKRSKSREKEKEKALLTARKSLSPLRFVLHIGENRAFRNMWHATVLPLECVTTFKFVITPRQGPRVMKIGPFLLNTRTQKEKKLSLAIINSPKNRSLS
jgi:hypothetical protein